jgi:hypothetical protein
LSIKAVLRALTAVALVTTGSTVFVTQPASAAEYYRARVYSLNTYLLPAAQRKAMAVVSASTANGANLIQYTPSAAAPDNDWMWLEFEAGSPIPGTTLVRIKPAHTFSNDGNPHNDKCLAISGAQSGWNRQIVNWTCSYDSIDNDVWIHEAYVWLPGGEFQYNRFRSRQHLDSCIVVQNASTANLARLITHSCTGGYNHYWVW